MKRFLSFDEDEHKYSLLFDPTREIVIPSVTQLLKFGGIINYDFISPMYARIGTEIHDMTEAIDRGDYPRELAEGRVQASMLAYESFLSDYDVVWDQTEEIIFSEDRFYAGTMDRLGTIDGQRVILDIKSGAKVRWHVLQLVAYAQEEEVGVASLYLQGFDYRYHVWSDKDIAEARKVWSSLLDVYWYTRVMDFRRLEKIREEVRGYTK